MRIKNLVTAIVATAAVTFVSSAALAANIAVIGGMTNDEFWNRIKKGVDDARSVVEANGGTVNYLQLQSYDNLGADAAQLVRTAISQGVDGIVVPNWVPEAQDEAIQAAIDADIKVILMNAGTLEKADELGAINFVGSDEYLAGFAGGEYFSSKGLSHVICVNTLPGAINLETRCQGVIDGFARSGGNAVQLPLPPTSFGDPVAVAEAIAATLARDESIDGVITISATDADSAASGIARTGRADSILLGTFDLNQSGLDRLQEGTQGFAIDQQPYLQSLLAVTVLASHIDFGTILPTRPVLTGPGIVDSDNLEATLAGVAAGAR